MYNPNNGRRNDQCLKTVLNTTFISKNKTSDLHSSFQIGLVFLLKRPPMGLKIKDIFLINYFVIFSVYIALIMHYWFQTTPSWLDQSNQMKKSIGVSTYVCLTQEEEKCRKRRTFPDSKQKITGTLVICYLCIFLCA
ncbi:unnamed protein product [Rhizopus stolonifer]